MKIDKMVLRTVTIVMKVVFAVLVVMFVYKYAFVAYDYGYSIFGEKPITSGEGRDITVVISDGDGAKEIGEVLESKGLIRDAQLFVFQVYLSDYKNSIVPGTYTLNTSMTAKQMMIAIENANIKPESTEDDTESGTEAIDNEESSEVNTEE